MSNNYGAYYAAHTSSILVDRSAAGRFELLDRDRLDLLHRMSTNDFTTMMPGEGRVTVLTTALARIIDQLIVFNRGETALAICGEGRVATVRRWLQGHIFFQDKVKTRDMSGETCQFGLFGVAAGAIAEQIAPGASRLPLHHFLDVSFAGASILIARSFPIAGDGYTIIAPIAERAALQNTILVSGNVQLTDSAAYELLRIEAGIPAAGHELTEEYIPLEAGLWDAVSFKKGCYIGQEIIARMESRNKVARTLIQMRVAELVPAGTALHSDDRVVGSITSVAALPDGEAVALGYVKADVADKLLLAVRETGESLHVEVTHIAHSREA